MILLCRANSVSTVMPNPVLFRAVVPGGLSMHRRGFIDRCTQRAYFRQRQAAALGPEVSAAHFGWTSVQQSAQICRWAARGFA